MKRSAAVGVQFKLDGVNPGAEVTAAPYSSNWDTKTPQSNGRRPRCCGQSDYVFSGHLVVANRLPMIEIDIEFEDLEEKTAPQSDTSYLDRVFRYF